MDPLKKSRIPDITIYIYERHWEYIYANIVIYIMFIGISNSIPVYLYIYIQTYKHNQMVASVAAD